MFMRDLEMGMNAFTSIAYTEGNQPRIARITRMKNVEGFASPRILLPDPCYPRHPR